MHPAQISPLPGPPALWHKARVQHLHGVTPPAGNRRRFAPRAAACATATPTPPIMIIGRNTICPSACTAGHVVREHGDHQSQSEECERSSRERSRQLHWMRGPRRAVHRPCQPRSASPLPIGRAPPAPLPCSTGFLPLRTAANGNAAIRRARALRRSPWACRSRYHLGW